MEIPVFNMKWTFKKKKKKDSGNYSEKKSKAGGSEVLDQRASEFFATYKNGIDSFILYLFHV